eukprot:CCRYP_012408-RA/>CCRYP_012408-RA protein AED:0.21 eAED:0.21 QI:0/0/0/1/1/1/2/0/880
MHAVSGYPVKSTWLKAVQAGNFIGWPLLTAKNVHKYYPDSVETPQGHLNQTHKNIRSTKPKPSPFEEIHSNQLRGRKVHNIYTKTYQLWDKLLPQTEITLNLLCQSNATPTVSAYAHLNGPFDYNKMPLAPMGCNAQIHEKTDSRGTWAFHSVDELYVSTSPEHYHTHRCHIKSTNSDRLCDTVHFHHKHITNPTLTPADKLMAAIADCSQALLTHAPPLGTSNLRQLQELLQQTSTQLNSADPVQQQHNMTYPPPRVEQRVEHPLPRVLDPNMRVTRSMTTLLPDAPPRPVSRMPRPSPQQRQHSARPPLSLPADTRAWNTRSQTAAVAKLAVPPALNTPSRTSRIPPPTPITRRQSSRLTRMENEVHKALAVLDKSTGKLLNYHQLLRHPVYQGDWTISSANEFGRLAQGVGGRIKGTDTIRFIRKSDIPHDRRKDVTYGRFVCNVRPEKAEPNRTHFTVGGDRINYPGEVATPTAEMLTTKLLFNSVISTPGGKFMTMDISNFYLMTPLPGPEYLRLKLSDIPTEIITEYRLDLLAEPDGTIYVLVRLGMYGLPQAGLLANELLEKRPNAHGYHQSKLVPGLWKHVWRPIQFTLVVDDFGIKYVGQEHPQHLLTVLQEHYTVTTDWNGSRYIGITLDWDYAKRRIYLSMPGYVKKALRQFQHPKPKTPQHAPFPTMPIKYGTHTQYATTPSTAPLLDQEGKKFIQQVCSKFLFLGRAVDPTLLCPISAIASQSSKPTVNTLKHPKQLLDYIATQDDAVLTYNASDMVLAIHSDASYLSKPGARSLAGGHFFLSSNAEIPPNNRAVLNIAHIIKHVMASATEAKLAALYIMAREAVFIRIILEELGHTQPATLQTDNSTAEGVVNGKVQPKWTKAMDM